MATHQRMPATSGSINRATDFFTYFSLFSRILPELEQQPLFDSVNFQVYIHEPRVTPPRPHELMALLPNTTALGTSLSVLLCPSDPSSVIQDGLAGANYRANAGSMIAFGVPRHGLEGPFSIIRFTSPAEITDGLSNTVSFSEKLRGNVGGGVYNPRADSLAFPYSRSIASSNYLRDCGQQVVRPDGFKDSCGTIWLVGSLTQTMYNHCEVPNSVWPDCYVRGYYPAFGTEPARSNHVSGVNAAMADGSVRFVKQTIDLEVWRAAGTRAGEDGGGLP